MPSKSTVPMFERRTRIACHFPLNRLPRGLKPNQIRVVHEFIKYLERTNLTGFTMSSLMDTVFTGFWRPSPAGKFDKENVALILIDHALQKDDPELWSFVAELRREIQRLYKRFVDQKEQDVWIVIYSIDRLV